ncbi:hypothetical protein [Caulobacter soli]|nr:hypothetical protein [Caulobacter soli]
MKRSLRTSLLLAAATFMSLTAAGPSIARDRETLMARALSCGSTTAPSRA